ncbi:MAG: hypothetical protein DU429_06860 [Candidatus Tokpelaia sp.]|nr:MAG: hypothetical protein DU430_07295 [Candidatus Tokpelaia sp.]KAA6206134.1 MAG: hypothetical protein DU429_06860 [Candidatus Tokpelaia sp.]
MQIDYVITWVDGQDPGHKAARKFYLAEDKKRAGGRAPNKEETKHGFEKTTKIRFQDNGEIYYNIASVLRYAPFIHKIFIVTDNQLPALLPDFVNEGKCPPGFLQLVSHDEIFAASADLPQFAAVRPSFNSRSIEAVLWRIPGLAEHFIFSNDDFFINAPVTAQDFFINGVPRLFGVWKSVGAVKLRHFYRQMLAGISAYRLPPRHSTSLWLGARLSGGFNSFGARFLAVPHYPHPLRKSTFADFFRANPAVLTRQLSFRFRAPQQFNPVSLANHLEIKRGAVPARPPDIIYLDDIKSPQHYAAILAKIQHSAGQFACIQDIGLYPPAAQAELHHVLVEKFRANLPETVRRHLLSLAHKAAEEAKNE